MRYCAQSTAGAGLYEKGCTMKTQNRVYSYLLAVLVLSYSAFGADQIPAHQASKITEAAPTNARVAPKRPRRVLIWITPAHMMASGQ